MLRTVRRGAVPLPCCLTTGFPLARAVEIDLLERPTGGISLARAVEIDLLERPTGPVRQRGEELEPTPRPFQSRTLRLTPAVADA